YKKMSLDLQYKLGHADIDLSGLAVSGLKVNTGSADVRIGYSAEMNQIEMDTFAVKVELGSLIIGKCNFSRAKNMIAEVGLGNLLLDFSTPSQMKGNVNLNVGAGKLEVILPKIQNPTIIYSNNSPLCHVNWTNLFIKHVPMFL
ncbi:MAG: hypothetical protein M3512_07455, partial [Bacteroidota bacterium]|nr:hypothetical protein [Bacteroidota bacterium]